MFNNYNDGTFKKVTKKTALKAYNNGANIYLLPCKACSKSYYIQPSRINKQLVNDSLRTITSVLNEYEIMNCNNYLGKYISYYLEA